MKREKCYRIVRDVFSGYEVQVKLTFLWWSWWHQPAYRTDGSCNTFSSIERAKQWIEQGCKKQPPIEQEKSVLWISEHCK